MRRSRKPRPFAKASKPKKVAGQKNATEKDYEDTFLRPAALRGEIVEWWYERWTWKLADDTRYTPDFVAQLADGSIEVHEVKGPWVADDSRVKVKVLADQFPLRCWWAQRASKKDGGQWTVTEVKSDTWSEAA